MFILQIQNNSNSNKILIPHVLFKFLCFEIMALKKHIVKHVLPQLLILISHPLASLVGGTEVQGRRKVKGLRMFKMTSEN